MRFELVLLSALAAGTLAALIDSARRMASTDPVGPEPLGSPTAALEELERARTRLDDHAARVLIGIGAASALAGCVAALLQPAALEVAAVLFAAGTGLAVPGLRWAREVRRERRSIDSRIGVLRARITSSSGVGRAQFPRSAAPLPRS